MAMKLYMTPGSCSTAIHIILEELEAVFEAHIVNLPAGDQFKPDYVAINPKSTIPTLVRPDGSALTEVQSIAYWLGRAHPRAGLWPQDLEAETRAIETMAFVVGNVHGHGFARIFSPGAFFPDSERHDVVQGQGRALVAKGFTILNAALQDRDYVAGTYSVADPVVFYVTFWADKIGLPIPPHLGAHYRRMLARRAVNQVLREEGYNPATLGKGLAAETAG